MLASQKKYVTCSLAVQLGSIHFLMIALRYNRKIGIFPMEAKTMGSELCKKINWNMTHIYDRLTCDALVAES
jgi:hypothetical protein